MTDDEKAAKARARFFRDVGRAGSQWADRNTLPLFPLFMVMDEAMLDADAKWEASKNLLPVDSSHG